VIVNPVRHTEIVANTMNLWDKITIKGDRWECAPDAEGKRHAPERRCANWIESDYGDGCAVDGRRKAQISLGTLEWTPTLLDYYWEHGIEGPGMQFLKGANFVMPYR
jgi:hypothetical protein